jgi:hypothetical protein
MKRNLLSLTVLLFVFINLLVFSLPAFAQVSGPPISNPVTCDVAKAYLEDKRIDLAEKAYTVILAQNPQEQCALEGLANVAQAKCALAATLATSNPAGANNIYAGILTSYPHLDCANQGWATVVTPIPSVTPTQTSTPTPNPFGVVTRLASIGEYSAAQTKMVEAVSTVSPATEIHRLFGRPYLYYQNIASNVIPRSLITILIAVILWLIIHFQKSHLDVEDFEVGTVKLAVPSPEGPDIKKILTLHFERDLNDLCCTVPLTKPDLITTPLEIPDLPNIASIPQEGRDIWTFLNKIIRPNLIKITGNLEFDPVRGAGLTTRLVRHRSNSILGTYTVWKEDIDPSFQAGGQAPTPEDYMDLVEPAAIWAYWHAYSGWRYTRKIQQSFGTSVCDSYTALKLAMHMNDEYKRLEDAEQQKTKLTAIRSLLGRAITYDDCNSIAHLNLGVILYLASQKADHTRSERDFMLEMAKKHLERARMLSSTPYNESDTTDSINYDDYACYINACYTMALIEIDAYLDELDQDQNLPATAKGDHLQKAEELLDKAYLGSTEALRQKKMLFTEDYSTMIHIPLLDVRWWMNEIVDNEDPVEKETANKVFAAPRIHYNLACHYSLAEKIMDRDEKRLDKALAWLEYAFCASPAYVGRAKDDKTLKHLRKEKKLEFENLVKKYSPSKSTYLGETQKIPIALMFGQENAIALKKQNIEIIAELLCRTMKREDRQKLAQECNLDEDDLLKWACASELIRISGVKENQVVLLYKAKIRTLDALARSNKHELFDTVKERKEMLKLDIELPDKETLAWWIQQAKRTWSIIQ